MPPRRSLPLHHAAAVLCVAGSGFVGGGCAAERPSAGGTANMIEQPQVASDFTRLSREEQVELLERDLRRHFGREVRVGQIRRIAKATRGAQIVDLDTAGLREGDSVLFVDQQGRAVAAGTLVLVKPLELIAEYDATLVEDGRALALDDFAVLNLTPDKPTEGD